MSKTSCIRHIPQTNMLIIRADFIAAVESVGGCPDDKCAAGILNMFEHWTNHKIGIMPQAMRENAIRVAGGLEPSQNDDFWIYKTQEELKSELMDIWGLNKVGACLNWLVGTGILACRQNPRYGWDRTKQYQLNANYLNRLLDAVSDTIFNSKASKLLNQSIKPHRIKEAIPIEHTIEHTVEKDSSVPDSDTNTSPELAGDVLPVADSGAKPKKARERDLMFDAVAKHLCGIKTPEELATMQSQEKYTTTRIGQFSSWLQGKVDYIGRGRSRQYVGLISKPAEPAHVKHFANWLAGRLKGATLPRDPEKLIEYWREFGSEMRRKSEMIQLREQSAAQRATQQVGMTDDERKEAIKVKPSWGK